MGGQEEDKHNEKNQEKRAQLRARVSQAIRNIRTKWVGQEKHSEMEEGYEEDKHKR